MWSRRRFLETVSTLPLVGGFIGGGVGRAEAAVVMGAPDYFRDLGVRPFINASGTYTAMTASLMPPEVMEAINYASKYYVMLEELQVKVGERIATLVQAEAGKIQEEKAAAIPPLRDVEARAAAALQRLVIARQVLGLRVV